MGSRDKSPEEVSILLLRALEAERRCQPSMLHAKTIEVIGEELIRRHCLTSVDITNAVRILAQKRFIEGMQREDGKAMHPTEEGRAYLQQMRRKRLRQLVIGSIAAIAVMIIAAFLFRKLPGY